MLYNVIQCYSITLKKGFQVGIIAYQYYIRLVTNITLRNYSKQTVYLRWISKGAITMHIGLPEILIVLVIVVVLFGVGRIGKLGSELGSGLRNFRDGLKGEKEEETEKTMDKKTK